MARYHSHSNGCPECATEIQTNLDEMLQLPAYRQLKLHLEHCPHCTLYLDSLKKLIVLYRRYPDQMVKTRMRQKLYSMLDLHN